MIVSNLTVWLGSITFGR